MAYTQYVFDNFNDNAIDTSKWTSVVSGYTESGGTFNFPNGTGYPTARGTPLYDISKGILAVKLTTTGTTGEETEFVFQAKDSSGNGVGIFATPYNATIAVQKSGSAVISSPVVVDTTVGLGPSWIDGSWLGIGNLGSDNIIHIYKSSDAVTWTEIARATVSGTFNRNQVGFYFSVGRWGASGAWTASFDDSCYWLVGSQSSSLFDNFDDNTIDLTKWNLLYGSDGITESGGKLNLADDPNSPVVLGNAPFNLNSGILAVKVAKTGTPNASTKVWIGVRDSIEGGVEMEATPNNATFSLVEGANNGPEIMSQTVFDTVGLGPSWTAGHWIGVGNVELSGTDRILHFYKSSNGSTWFEIARCVMFGTVSFVEESASFVFGTNDSGATWSVNLDDATFFSNIGVPLTKVRVSGAWVDAKMKVRVGGAWVAAKPKVRVGGAWVIP